MNKAIIPGYRTDHSGIVLKLEFQNMEGGKGYWKFNNSLLRDKKYIDQVKDIDLEQISDCDLDLNIKEQLFLETLLMMIRGITIKYGSFKKTKMKKRKQ